MLLRWEREDEVLYLFPGGGHEPGETLPETAEREVLEETGLRVKAGRMLAAHEHAPFRISGSYDDIRELYFGETHRVDFFFECVTVKDVAPRITGEGSLLQAGFEWVLLDDLEFMPVVPQIGTQLSDAMRLPASLLYESHD